MLNKQFDNLKNLKFSPKIFEMLEKYRFLIAEYNKIMNLTRIVDKQEIYFKHFYDALLITNEVDLAGKSICDVGSGLGVPGIVLKICVPSIKLTIIESNKKKCEFLDAVIKELKFSAIEIINERVENFIEKNRESYDVVVARALAPLTICNELCLPLVKIKGIFAAYKGANLEQELAKSQKSINLLGGEILKTLNYDLPYNFGNRKILLIKKIKISPKKFPRPFGQIKNKPL